MVLVDVCELKDEALDWACAKAEGADFRVVSGIVEVKFVDAFYQNLTEYAADLSRLEQIIERDIQQQIPTTE